MKKNLFVLIVVLAVVGVTTSCNKFSLKEKEAWDLIHKDLDLNHSFCIALSSRTSSGNYTGLQYLKVLNNDGFIHQENDSYYYNNRIRYDAIPTILDKMKEYVVTQDTETAGNSGWDAKIDLESKNWFFMAKTFTIYARSIDGILLNETNQTATVRFTLFFKDLAPYVTKVETLFDFRKPITYEFLYKKFDTGWQLDLSNKHIDNTNDRRETTKLLKSIIAEAGFNNIYFYRSYWEMIRTGEVYNKDKH